MKNKFTRLFIIFNLNCAIMSSAMACGGGYTGYQINPNGTYAVGGAYTGYQINPNGTYAVGGAYTGYQINPDGTYAVGNCTNL